MKTKENGFAHNTKPDKQFVEFDRRGVNKEFSTRLYFSQTDKSTGHRSPCI